MPTSAPSTVGRVLGKAGSSMLVISAANGGLPKTARRTFAIILYNVVRMRKSIPNQFLIKDNVLRRTFLTGMELGSILKQALIKIVSHIDNVCFIRLSGA